MPYVTTNNHTVEKPALYLFRTFLNSAMNPTNVREGSIIQYVRPKMYWSSATCQHLIGQIFIVISIVSDTRVEALGHYPGSSFGEFTINQKECKIIGHIEEKIANRYHFDMILQFINDHPHLKKTCIGIRNQ